MSATLTHVDPAAVPTVNHNAEGNGFPWEEHAQFLSSDKGLKTRCVGGGWSAVCNNINPGYTDERSILR